MSITYPLELQREVERRWAHRLVGPGRRVLGRVSSATETPLGPKLGTRQAIGRVTDTGPAEILDQSAA